MYNIFDLKEMDLEQLRTLGQDLQIKGSKKMDKEDLVYAILDAEAEKNAKNAPERPEKKKRGRPKKSEETAAAAVPAAEKAVEKPAEKAEKKTEKKAEKPNRKPAKEVKPVETKRGCFC